MNPDFCDLQKRYAELLMLLSPHKPRYSSQTSIQTRRGDDGSAHVERVNGNYHYVITERGSEIERKVAQSAYELMYWLADGVTTGIALQIERENRIPGEDFRRQYFAMNLRLLTRLSSEWADWKRSEYQRILIQHPYRDKV